MLLQTRPRRPPGVDPDQRGGNRIDNRNHQERRSKVALPGLVQKNLLMLCSAPVLSQDLNANNAKRLGRAQPLQLTLIRRFWRSGPTLLIAALQLCFSTSLRGQVNWEASRNGRSVVRCNDLVPLSKREPVSKKPITILATVIWTLIAIGGTRDVERQLPAQRWGLCEAAHVPGRLAACLRAGPLGSQGFSSVTSLRCQLPAEKAPEASGIFSVLPKS
ncbi:hypothetical protein H920_07273 [Fukomys damarensis]|uniref:Uncharacterized protein n=1 Tax=Fukomys damarensis TaxID=885580 RepID=A0A091DLK3_FUKDA|nr:hypothetical protein H920_07273 [Fukomys damarensis]